MQTSKCIYCLQEKNISEFNSEHVVSRFIGRYAKNAMTISARRLKMIYPLTRLKAY